MPSEVTLKKARELAHSRGLRTCLVVDQRGLIRVLNLATLERELNEETTKQLGDIVDGINFPHAHPDQGLDLALERMGANQIELLPVVDRADIYINWRALLRCAIF